MNHEAKSRTPKPIKFLFEYSIFLLAGSLAALIWANADHASYQKFVSFEFKTIFNGEPDTHAAPDKAAHGAAGSHAEDVEHGHQEEQAHGDQDDHSHEDGSTSHAEDAVGHADHHAFNVTFLINNVLMALFFAIAGKEVWEALLPGGPLSNPRKAAMPLLATLGGIIGPAGVYVVGALALGQWGQLGNGWAIPCATDIAFSYLVARLIFGNGHPAIAFLLLLAIADDAAGLVILAVFYPDPSAPVQPVWLLLTVAAVLIGFGFRKLKLVNFWWYLLIPGTLSWISFYMTGIHAALGLVAIIPTMPHAHTDLGLFARNELNKDDTLSAFEHWWKNPVEIILGLFGLVNAGVVLSNVGHGTWLVLGGLLLGKPVGILFFSWLGEKLFKLEIPGGMSYRHIASLGMVAGIGFTVALFVSTAAFPTPGFVQDSVKMGALASFFAAVIAFVGARLLGVRPLTPKEEEAVATA